MRQDIDQNEYYDKIQETFVRFIKEWKLGETNSALGAVLEEKVYTLLAHHVRELRAANDQLLEYSDFIKVVANNEESAVLRTMAMKILTNKA